MNEAASPRSLPEASDIAADFDAGIDSHFIDWSPVEGGASSVRGLITIDGQDHLMTIQVESEIDGWKVCGYRLSPVA